MCIHSNDNLPAQIPTKSLDSDGLYTSRLGPIPSTNATPKQL